MQSINKCFTQLRSHHQNNKKRATQTLWVDVNDLDNKLKTIEQHRKVNGDNQVSQINLKNNQGQKRYLRNNSSKQIGLESQTKTQNHQRKITQLIESNHLQHKKSEIFTAEVNRKPLGDSRNRVDSNLYKTERSNNIEKNTNSNLHIPQQLLFKKQQKTVDNQQKTSPQIEQKHQKLNLNQIQIKYQNKLNNFDSPSNKQNNKVTFSMQNANNQPFSKKQIENKLQAIKSKINGLNFNVQSEKPKTAMKNSNQNSRKVTIETINQVPSKSEVKNNANSMKTVKVPNKNKIMNNHISQRNFIKPEEKNPKTINSTKSYAAFKEQDLQLTENMLNKYKKAYGDNKMKSQKIELLFSELKTIINDS